MIKEIESLCE
jgi:FtsZ-binding cell division protein ZapB